MKESIQLPASVHKSQENGSMHWYCPTSFYLKRLIKVGSAVSSFINRLTLACSVWFDFKPVHMISHRRK